MSLLPAVPQRTRRLLGWLFRRGREGRERWRNLPLGLGIVLGASLLNGACEGAGLYERLEWSDLDRFQRTASPTGPGGIALVHIGDEEYDTYFGARSPLDPERLTDLVAAICAAAPRALAVDILTGSWPSDFYSERAAPRLSGCPIVWIRDSEGVLGSAEPPPGACTAVPLFQPDRDGVVRRYQPWFPGFGSDGTAGAARVPSLTGVLARDDIGRCGGTSEGAGEPPPSHRIRFTSHDNFTALPARFLIESAGDPDAAGGFRELLRDRVVILGGTYRHARDRHLTPLGAIHGSELLASSVYTARMAPIVEISWVQAFLITLAVSLGLLVALAWADLRWAWATLASLVLSAGAAALISWHVFNYLGYFLGVLAGLMGVVLAELMTVLWPTFRQMGAQWLAEYPQGPMPAEPVAEEPLAEEPAAEPILSTPETRADA